MDEKKSQIPLPLRFLLENSKIGGGDGQEAGVFVLTGDCGSILPVFSSVEKADAFVRRNSVFAVGLRKVADREQLRLLVSMLAKMDVEWLAVHPISADGGIGIIRVDDVRQSFGDEVV